VRLLRRYGSVARLRQLSVEELAAELPRNRAQRVYDVLHGVSPSEAAPPESPR
jgi:excinuclease UvrABC nuclease subunit